MWNSKASATSATPIRIRKASASTLIVGWRAMKRLIPPATNIMNATAMTMAAIMISTCCTRPTAVSTESSENTMSMTAICAITAAKPATAARRRGTPDGPSTLAWISTTLFHSRNKPPVPSTRSRPEKSWPNACSSGVVSVASQVTDSSSRMRVSIARPRPTIRAGPCCADGRRSTRIDRKMTLSTPSTTSSTVSVASDSHAAGSVSSVSMAPAPGRGSGQVVDRRAPLRRHEVAVRRVEVERDAARDVHRGVGDREDADDQRRAEAAQRLAAEQVQRDDHDQRRELRDHRPRQRLVDRAVEDLERLCLAHDREQLADAVEDDDRLVDRVAEHRQHRGQHRQIEGHAGDREHADEDERVVQRRDDRADAELPAEAERDVAEDGDQRRDQRLQPLDDQLLADLRADDLGALQLHAGIDG